MGPQPNSADIVELKKELQATREKCRQLEEELAQVSIINRWNIGEYLHDNLAQKLNYAKILAKLLQRDLPESRTDLTEQCQEVVDIICEGTNDVRDLSHDIIPLEMDTEGVLEAFQYLKEQVEGFHGIECQLEIDEVIQKVFNRKIASNLYLIAQEAVKNAVIHGKANMVRLVLIEHNRQLYLHVKDDGNGFTPNSKSGIGLDIMKHRAKEVGGTFRIREAKKQGSFSTYVTCTVPLEVLSEESSIPSPDASIDVTT